MSEFGFSSTADEVLEGKDLTGKTAFITGGYSGLGKETARAMAAKGAHVIVAGRDIEKANTAAEEIRSEVEGAHIETILCDLGSLEAVRACGEEAQQRFDKIDLLINNAGVMACPKGETSDGFEMQFGTNHLGHFVLTKHLLPLVEKGEDARIINLSSRGHHLDTVHLDDPNYEHREYEKWPAYGQSKTANILFSVGLANRFGHKGITALALHPGGIMTNLGRHMTEEDLTWMRKRMEDNAKDGGEGLKTIPQGAATTCFAATEPSLQGHGGQYLEDCHVAEVDDESSSGGVRSYALDPKTADDLWALSERLVGETFSN
ncbi:SDR family NAD(P)-dependent oxidoreductase [Parerythrobacter jejuensis]|uniref:Probable oxidoreductase n=1 Tax=Parerythrobacter jejuensis TaxID=795812 RepID=A0A845ALV1_9SPHN|nr:SDR family NAD(P)-dependent oxidoreductase [Parerythrobacter jejuensis]MXP30449.1 SDR family NAD(P)-dependent oxidoreductase [Parerythrobacter jejuensis]MXP33209.1 SDR family NAD(P)-dependent oxidoreductase [Parerythrobacter jejuensis]